MTETPIDTTPAGGDGKILALFREFMTASCAARPDDEKEREAAWDRIGKLEDAIIQMPSTSAADLAIKTCLVVPDLGQGDWGRALMRDAVHFVPELAPLAADCLNPPPPPPIERLIPGYDFDRECRELSDA